MSLSLRAGAIVAAALAVAPAYGQYPFGAGTPVNGQTPTLIGEPLWFGNAAYGYHVRGGPPGGGAALLVTVHTAPQSLLGLTVYVDLDPAQILVADVAGLDAAGATFFHRPLSGPENPALAGIDLYAQAAVVDPITGATGCTQPLLLEVALHPLFAYGSSAAGVVLFDPILGATTVVGGLPASTEIHDLEFANGGRDLFVATQAGLFVVDVTSPAPAGSLFAAAVANSLAVDRVTGRLYALGGYSGLLTVYDAAAGAPGFGTVVGLTGHFAHTLDLSTDGRRLALAHAFGSIQVLNSDASSPAYLQPIASATPAVIPTPGIGSQPVVVSGDGRVVSVPLRTGLPVPKSQLWRYDVDLGQWIDHDPAGAGVQPLSADVAPLLSTTFGYLIARNGVEAYAPNASGVQRLTYDLAEPTSFALQSTAMPASGAGGGVSRRYLTASPSGRYLTTRLAPLAGTGPNTFHVVDVATGAEALLGTLAGGGGASAPGVGVWR